MAKAVQYFNGTDYTQFGLDVVDYTTTNGIICQFFYTIKDSKDNIYIACFTNGTGWDDGIPFIKITSLGVKTVTKIASYDDECRNSSNFSLSLTRDELNIYAVFTSSPVAGLKILKTDMTTTTIRTAPILTDVSKFAIYQDRYIWVASGTTVKIYDYTTKAELASSTIDNSAKGIILDSLNNLYVIESYIPYGFQDRIYKFSFNGVTISQSIVYQANTAPFANAKQLLIDKYGDLIILTNSGTASTLLKYTTAGVQIGTEPLNLNGAYFNLNTDKDGNYYYSNTLGTYKITANTAQGQVFTGVGTKIRGSGMTTYGNNITNYNPAVFGTQE